MKKLILGFAGCALVLALSVILSNGFVDAHGNSTESPVRHKYYKSIEIASGDTLWDIAKEYMNEDYDSIYAYIDELKYINGLTSDGIQEGQYHILYSPNLRRPAAMELFLCCRTLAF